MKAVLYICHGSKNNQTNRKYQLELEEMKWYINAPIQVTAFLEVEPSIIAGINQCVKKGATEITLIPVFLLPGVHVIDDIPNEVKKASRKFPGLTIHISAPLGAGDQLITDTEQRIMSKRINTKQKEAVLLVSHGSSYAEASDTFRYFGGELEDRLVELPVFESYLNSNEPKFEFKLEQLLSSGFEVIYLVPHFFSIGFFPEKIKQTADVIQQKYESSLIVDVKAIAFNRDIYTCIAANVNGAFEIE